MAAELQWSLLHQHGKSRVRVGRVWRQGSQHVFVEWSVDVSLTSVCDNAFTIGDNSAIVATDTIKNTIYWLAKQCNQPLSLEDFGIVAAKHFVSVYDEVTGAKISLTEKPWQRVEENGQQHDHGFRLGSGVRIAEVVAANGQFSVTSGFQNVSVLKTTQSGFEKFIHDQYTLLSDCTERMLASSITAAWRYEGKPKLSYNDTFTAVQTLLLNTFYGPPSGGVYSPSVQNTLFLMAEAVLKSFPEVESIKLKMPNLHFLPAHMPGIGVKFENDVYTPTDEPHGTIEASLARPHPLLQSML